MTGLDSLVADYKNLVYHLIYRTVFDRDAHDELFQEVFLQIFKGLNGFKGRSRLSTWVAAVTLNTCFNHIRKSSGSNTRSLEQWLVQGGEVPTRSTSPQTLAETEDSGIKIDAALNRLANNYKIPLVLFYFENYTYKQIADVLKCPLGTVKSNLFRGLKELRRMLGGNINEFL